MSKPNTKDTQKPDAPSAPTDAEILAAAETFETKYAEQIAAREAAGLTREQAVECQRAQVRHDLANAPASKK